MSTPAATARYVIAADDKTKAAVAAVTNGFRGMERGIKGTVNRINAAFALVAGGVLAKSLRSVFAETAKGSTEFAAALDEAKRAARSLLAAKDGAPAAAAAMRELSEVLKDPEFVEAADRIASAFIRGFAGTVKFVAGVKSLREEIEELKRQRDSLASDENQPRTYIKGEPTFVNRGVAQYGLTLEIEKKERELREQEAAEAERRAEFKRKEEAGARRFHTMREFEENIKFFEDIEKKKKPSDGPAGDTGFFDQLARDADLAAIKMRETFFDRIAKDAGDVGETLGRTGDSIEETGDKIGETINKTAQWSAVADQAARNIQDSFANFVFDPFEDGLKGMLKGFLDVLRRIVAETAAAKIFGSKKDGGLGLGDAIGGLFSGFMSADTGIKRVPRDNQPFLLHKDEAVLPAAMNPWAGRRGTMAGGGVNFSAVYNIDARGATHDAIKLLPAAMQQAHDRAVATIRENVRRTGRV